MNSVTSPVTTLNGFNLIIIELPLILKRHGLSEMHRYPPIFGPLAERAQNRLFGGEHDKVLGLLEEEPAARRPDPGIDHTTLDTITLEWALVIAEHVSHSTFRHTLLLESLREFIAEEIFRMGYVNIRNLCTIPTSWPSYQLWQKLADKTGCRNGHI